MNDHLQSHGLI